MTVTRVWKGNVASTTALHRWCTEGRASGGGFEAGTEYLAIAHELSPGRVRGSVFRGRVSVRSASTAGEPAA